MLCLSVLHAPVQWIMTIKQVAVVLCRHLESCFSADLFFRTILLSSDNLEPQGKRPWLHFKLKSDSTGKVKPSFHRWRRASLRGDLPSLVNVLIILEINIHLHLHHHQHFHHYCFYGFYCLELPVSVNSFNSLNSMKQVGRYYFTLNWQSRRQRPGNWNNFHMVTMLELGLWSKPSCIQNLAPPLQTVWPPGA